MRRLVLALAALAASAITASAEPAPAARPILTDMPRRLALPRAATTEAILAARGNLVRWRDAEIARLNDPTSNPAHDDIRREVGGFFMVLEEGYARRGAVLFGFWRDPHPGYPEAGIMRGDLVHGALRCGATAGGFPPSDIAFLGQRWDERWKDVSDTLAGQTPTATQPSPSPARAR